ncbi:hypothetical protein GW17_00060688 [Ensete ventricosum]|nr:hypothetical protein GW17_00060688 [Ensete ventricosum]
MRLAQPRQRWRPSLNPEAVRSASYRRATTGARGVCGRCFSPGSISTEAVAVELTEMAIGGAGKLGCDGFRSGAVVVHLLDGAFSLDLLHNDNMRLSLLQCRGRATNDDDDELSSSLPAAPAICWKQTRDE